MKKNSITKKQSEALQPKNIGKTLVHSIGKLNDISATGTAMMQVSQEFLLAVEDILVKEHNFSEAEIKQLEESLRYYLTTLAHVEREGLSILSRHDMKAIGEIAEIRKIRESSSNNGIALPKPNKTEILSKLLK